MDPIAQRVGIAGLALAFSILAIGRAMEMSNCIYDTAPVCYQLDAMNILHPSPCDTTADLMPMTDGLIDDQQSP